MNKYHTPVLLQEVLTQLSIKSGDVYVDGTLGGGGHTLALLEKGVKVIGIDQDVDAIEFATSRLAEAGFEINKDFWIVKSNFSQIKSVVKDLGFEKIDGILLDIGISSHHIDAPERGFSFQEGPLDMRMDKDLSVSAKELVNGLTKDELEELFVRFGEEPRAKKYANLIATQRKVAPFETTTQLASLFKGSFEGVHPATRVFQALRIVVNDELNVLTAVLPDAIELLNPGKRLAVISFHSLEDRIVKNTFKDFEEKGIGKIITDKPITPSQEEVLLNKRSRSAKLRVIEKI